MTKPLTMASPLVKQPRNLHSNGETLCKITHRKSIQRELKTVAAHKKGKNVSIDTRGTASWQRRSTTSISSPHTTSRSAFVHYLFASTNNSSNKDRRTRQLHASVRAPSQQVGVGAPSNIQVGLATGTRTPPRPENQSERNLCSAVSSKGWL